MTPEQRNKFISWSYKRMLEERRGHYYPYWDDEKYKDWKEYKTTTSEELAKAYLEEAKIEFGTHRKYKKAKIVCGFIKSVQRVKHYTIIYKE